ncbi:MAG: hypothetical protein OXH39_06180 [Candidatus Poribacteria bacterium]|nr:hypothetical protein [Candidatus Poribacteria bacterium]
MKQSLTEFTFTVLILINITGCSVVRFAETRIGYGVKKANKTKMDLDFQLGFNVTNHSLSVTLEHQPYTIYKPRITLTDLGVGLASLGLLGKVLYDNWDHDYTFTFVDDTFDWYGSEPWEKAVMIGVPADILLYWTFSYPFDRRAIRTARQPLINHPYRIELPDYDDIGIDYRTTSGAEYIEIKDFLEKLKNRSVLQDIKSQDIISLQFRASTQVGRKKHSRDYTVSGIIIPNLDPPTPIQPPPPPVSQVEVDVQWIEHRLRVGEKATLKVTVKNSDQTTLAEFAAITDSSNPRFNNWKLKFGDIAPGASVTRALGFSTDSEMAPQEVHVTLRFEAANNLTHPEIQKTLSIVE